MTGILIQRDTPTGEAATRRRGTDGKEHHLLPTSQQLPSSTPIPPAAFPLPTPIPCCPQPQPTSWHSHPGIHPEPLHHCCQPPAKSPNGGGSSVASGASMKLGSIAPSPEAEPSTHYSAPQVGSRPWPLPVEGGYHHIWQPCPNCQVTHHSPARTGARPWPSKQ